MKNILIFIAGIITGVVGLFFVSFIITTNNSTDYGVTLFETTGDYSSNNKFKVFQVLESGSALAHELDGKYEFEGQVVLFLKQDNEYFYDDQIIEAPKDKAVKQIGIYRYGTNSGIEKTVPVVSIKE